MGAYVKQSNLWQIKLSCHLKKLCSRWSGFSAPYLGNLKRSDKQI